MNNYAYRKFKDKLFYILCSICIVAAVVPLLSIFIEVIVRDNARLGVDVPQMSSDDGRLRIGIYAEDGGDLLGRPNGFDVQVLPGITFPYVSGPWADRDTGQPLWTVPPA